MPLHLEVVTPSGSVLTEEVHSVRLPGRQGELTILERHRPLLADLKPGVLEFSVHEKSTALAIGGGFVEVGAMDKVLVLTDDHAFAKDVDRAAVAAELKRLEEQILTFAEPIDAYDVDKQGYRQSADHRVLIEQRDWAKAQLDLPTAKG